MDLNVRLHIPSAIEPSPESSLPELSEVSLPEKPE